MQNPDRLQNVLRELTKFPAFSISRLYGFLPYVDEVDQEVPDSEIRLEDSLLGAVGSGQPKSIRAIQRNMPNSAV